MWEKIKSFYNKDNYDLSKDVDPFEFHETFYKVHVAFKLADLGNKNPPSLMEDYAIVYKKLLLFEQTMCGPVCCLTAYCVAEKLDNGEFQVILLMLCVATFILHFVPSYMCTYLAYKKMTSAYSFFNMLRQT